MDSMNGADCMDDQQLWNRGMERLAIIQAGLPVRAREELTQLLNRYQKAKESLSALTDVVDAASECRDCRGQCCLNGKYRVSVLDLLARIAAHIPTEADFTLKPLCPYGSDTGCTMTAGFRPADCVMFVCDAIDGKLSPEAGIVSVQLERELRRCIAEASVLTGEKTGMPLLLWADITDAGTNL